MKDNLFLKEGIIHFKNFLNETLLNKINSEIDEISNQYLINGNNRASIWINKNEFEIVNPIINIGSINLLNIAFQVFKKIKENLQEEYTLTTLRIIDEKKNIHPIDWHTDNSPDVLRGIIYLKGGDNNNGNLSFVKGSHNIKHEKNLYFLNVSKFNKENEILSYSTKPGDLILFDINGFHKKNKVSTERRVLFLEFQKQMSDKKKVKIIFDNSKITPEMLHFSNFLFYKKDGIEFENPKYYNNLIVHTPLKIFTYYFKTFFQLQAKKIINKINFF